MNVEAMTWLVMIGLPCWGIVGVIRWALTAERPWQTSIGSLAFDCRPLLVVPVVALMFAGKVSLSSYWPACSASQAGCSRIIPAANAPAKTKLPPTASASLRVRI